MSSRPGALGAALTDLLRASHLLEPDELPARTAAIAGRLGARRFAIYLVDHGQVELRRFDPPGAEPCEPLGVDTTAAGMAFRHVQPLSFDAEGARHLWMPLLDGTDRLGVLEVELAAGAAVALDDWGAFGALVADLIVTKAVYGDAIERVRRRRPMAVRAEAQRSLLPPLTVISPRVAVAGMLEPSYEVAGDAFDYALNGDTLYLAIIDAMGHSLGATLTAAVVLAACRNARRGGGGLVDCWRAADRDLAREFDGECFATALMAELDLETGHLRYLLAGHPPPLLVRNGGAVALPEPEPTLPLGLRGSEPAIATVPLEPRDRLLGFTDGIVEARSGQGAFFGEDRLVDHLEREAATGLPSAEIVRRLVRAVAEHQQDALGDDATLVLLEWLAGDRDGLAGQLPAGARRS